MTTSTLINNLTAEELFSRFDNILSELKEIRNNFEPKTPTEYLTRSEVRELLKCDITTVHNWTKSGKIIAYGIGNRVYYKRHEIEQSLIPLRSRRVN